MSILDWFDIHDIEHLKAWQHLKDKGMWPEGYGVSFCLAGFNCGKDGVGMG